MCFDLFIDTFLHFPRHFQRFLEIIATMKEQKFYSSEYVNKKCEQNPWIKKHLLRINILYKYHILYFLQASVTVWPRNQPNFLSVRKPLFVLSMLIPGVTCIAAAFLPVSCSNPLMTIGDMIHHNRFGSSDYSFYRI